MGCVKSVICSAVVSVGLFTAGLFAAPILSAGLISAGISGAMNCYHQRNNPNFSIKHFAKDVLVGGLSGVGSAGFGSVLSKALPVTSRAAATIATRAASESAVGAVTNIVQQKMYGKKNIDFKEVGISAAQGFFSGATSSGFECIKPFKTNITHQFNFKNTMKAGAITAATGAASEFTRQALDGESISFKNILKTATLGAAVGGTLKTVQHHQEAYRDNYKVKLNNKQPSFGRRMANAGNNAFIRTTQEVAPTILDNSNNLYTQCYDQRCHDYYAPRETEKRSLDR